MNIDMFFTIFYFNLLILLNKQKSVESNSNLNVLEIDDRIIEFSKTGKWLIKFYAPWCGHCKKFESVYEEVGKYFSPSNINVVRIDATKYNRAASNFDVRGYPTLKFISSNVVYTFNGDRKLNDIVQFIERADGPRLRSINSISDYSNAKSKHKLFFLLIIQNENDTSILRNAYKTLAERYFLDTYFYICTKSELLSKFIDVERLPSVFVIKEENNYQWNNHTENNSDSLEGFIKNEQFLSFNPLSITNFNNLVETRKILLILFTGDTILNTNQKLKEQFKSYSEMHRDLYKEFQFAYTETNELLNNIAIWSLEAPLLFILNSTNYKYSIIYFNQSKLPNTKDIDLIIKNIRDLKIEFHGGDGWFRHLRRPLWELYRGIIEMFVEAPFISLLIFGIPFGVISIVCYFLCCYEGTDQPDIDEIMNESEIEDIDEMESNEDEMIEQEQEMNDENLVNENKIEEETKKTI